MRLLIDRVVMGIAVLAVVTPFVAGATDGAWNWAATTASGDMDVRVRQWDWNSASNWVAGTMPSGDTSVAFLVPSNQPTSLASAGARWIRVPAAGVELGEVNVRQNASIYLTGGPLRFGTSSTLNANFSRIRDEGASCTVYYYTPIDMTRKDTTLNRAYFCGPFAYPKGNVLANSNFIRWYGNAWATNASSVVTNPFPEATLSIGSGNVFLFARMGAAAQSGTWRTYTNSPILTRMGAVHDLAAGASVTGANIPAGAFIKSIFNDGAIEISEPCLGDSDAAGETVSFGAFENVRTIQHFPLLKTQASSPESNVVTYGFNKYRAQDAFDVYLDDIDGCVKLSQTDSMQRSFAAAQGAYYPARIFLKSATTANSKTPEICRFVQLGLVHLVFAPANGMAFTLNALDFKEGVTVLDVGPTLETPDGVTATIGDVRNWLLSVTKTGAGTLDMKSPTVIAHHALTCAGGTTILRMVAPSANQTFDALTVSQGATFRLAEGTLAVGTTTFASGAKLAADEGAVLDLSAATFASGVTFQGPGTFIVNSASALSGAVLENTPIFRFANAGTARDITSADDVIPAVVGHPAFWVDAAKNVDLMTFVWEGKTYTNGIACWRDCRDGETAYYATNDFSQLAVQTGIPGRYEVNMYNGLPCVWHDGIATAGQSNYRQIQSGMVWNKAITNVCAVFHVVYATGSGGNAILGCTKRFREMGTATNFNDFGRGVNSSTDGGGVGTWSNYLLASGVPSHVRNGWLYVNGQEWNLSVKMPSTLSVPYVLEVHPLPPYGRADAFAIQEHAGVTCSGCMRQMECIVYTNELTVTERRQVCAYLMKKYRNAAVEYNLSDSRFTSKSNLDVLNATRDVGVNVAAGRVMGFTTLTNGATLVKTGVGTLYADLVDGASLDVREGEMVIRSRELTADVVPPGAFVHLDATASNRMTLTSRTYLDGITRNEVTHWRDLSGASPVSAQRRTTDGRYTGPYLSFPASLGGRPVVDYGVFTNTSLSTDLDYGWGLFHDFVWQETDNGPMNYTNLTTVGSVFLMIGSKNGGGVPLGRYDTTSWRTATANPAVPFFNASAPTGFRSGGNWLNGVKTAFTNEGLSGGYDIVSFRDALGAGGSVQSLMMANERRFTGGGELGEVLVYATPLSYYTHQVVDAWLNWKWFARKTAGYAPSVANEVTLAAGATLTVEGGTPLTAAMLSGAGTVDGSLCCATGCVVTAKIGTNGGVETLSVTGAFDASAGGVVRLEGETSLLNRGRYPLVMAASTTEDRAWTVEGAMRPCFEYVVHVRSDGLYLDVLSKGLMLLFR